VLQAVVWEHTKSPYANLGYKCPGVYKKNPKHKTAASTEFQYIWYEAAKEDGGRERGRDGWTFSDFMNNNGEDCVMIQSTKLTGKLLYKPVAIARKSSSVTRRGQLLDTSVSFTGGKFAGGLKLGANKGYEVRIGIGDQSESITGSDLSYCREDFLPGVIYGVVLHDEKSTMIVVDGSDLKWSESRVVNALSHFDTDFVSVAFADDSVFRADLQEAEVIVGRLYTGTRLTAG
jgi:hypothetical protein